MMKTIEDRNNLNIVLQWSVEVKSLVSGEDVELEFSVHCSQFATLLDRKSLLFDKHCPIHNQTLWIIHFCKNNYYERIVMT